MRILFTADIHIKIGAKNVPVDWAKARYNSFISQLCEASSAVDLVVIGGDTFDKVPSIEELEIYFNLVDNLETPTIIMDGNHEATKKGKTFLSALSSVTNSLNPKVNVITEVTTYPWGHIVPYCAIKQKDVFSGLSKDRPLFSHIRGEIPPHVKSEIDLDLLKDFPLVFAGDLHSHSNTQRNIVYPGSPLTTSFHRTEVQTGYLIIEDGSWTWHKFNLPQLIRKTVNSEEEMMQTAFHHTIYEMEGSMSDLANVKNSDLLDKKIVKRSTESSLILSKEMTVAQELSEYLLYILELEDTLVQDTVGVFSDYTKEHQMG